MSTHGTSGDGPGSGVGGGRSGWASPLGAGLPGAAEVEGVEGDARNAVTARGVGAGEAPSGGGQGGEGVRGTQPQPDPGTGGGEGLAAQGAPGAVPGALPGPAEETSEAFLETPRGREMFQDFLAALARRPAPSEAPDQGGSAATSATAGTVAPITASTAHPSLPAAMATGGVPGPSPMIPARPGGDVPALAQPLPWHDPTRRPDAPQPGLVPGPAPAMPESSFAASMVPASAAGGNSGLGPAPATTTSTGGSGTTEPETMADNPALQTFLRNALNQALRLYSSGGAAATSEPPPPMTTSVPRQTAAPTGYSPPVGPVPTPAIEGYASQTGFLPGQPVQGVPAYVSTPATAFTPSGVSRAAIPSYGGVSINVPETMGMQGQGALPPGAFYPPYQPAMLATLKWSAAGPYGGPVATMERPPAQGAYAYGGQGGGYGVPATAGYQTSSRPVIGIPNELRNAVKVIVPFQSESATSERAATFWRSFETCTHGMDDQMRLTAFEQCLKGKLGLEWW
jgi:hypothetical protein